MLWIIYCWELLTVQGEQKTLNIFNSRNLKFEEVWRNLKWIQVYYSRTLIKEKIFRDQFFLTQPEKRIEQNLKVKEREIVSIVTTQYCTSSALKWSTITTIVSEEWRKTTLFHYFNIVRVFQQKKQLKSLMTEASFTLLCVLKYFTSFSVFIF